MPFKKLRATFDFGGTNYQGVSLVVLLKGSEPMGLAFVFLIVGFVAGYSVREAISQFRRARARRERWQHPTGRAQQL